MLQCNTNIDGKRQYFVGYCRELVIDNARNEQHKVDSRSFKELQGNFAIGFIEARSVCTVHACKSGYIPPIP